MNYKFPVFKNDFLDLDIIIDDKTAQEIVMSYYKIQGTRHHFSNVNKDSTADYNKYSSAVSSNIITMEKSTQNLLKPYVNSSFPGSWALSNPEITVVTAAGLIAFSDFSKTTSLSQYLNTTGIDTKTDKSVRTSKPLNILAWKITKSIVSLANRNNCHYSNLYKADKAYRTDMNNDKHYAEKAEQMLKSPDWNKDDTSHLLTEGILPPSYIDSLAQRFATKIFLSHLYVVAYEHIHNTPCTDYEPYAKKTLGHLRDVDYTIIPNYTHS